MTHEQQVLPAPPEGTTSDDGTLRFSAVYYVSVPPAMDGGRIFFRDPRGPMVAMYETARIDLPWIGTGVGIPFTPATGQILIFPAWLEHRVEPFQGDGERISIAFNVTNP